MDRRPRARIGGKILTQLFAGAGAGKTNNNAKQRAKARQNAAKATRGGARIPQKRATGVLAEAGSSSGGPPLPPADPLPPAPSSGSVAEEEEEMILPPRAPRARITVGNRLSKFRANRAAAAAEAAPKKAANKAAREKAAANKAAVELSRLMQLVVGNGSQPISRMNRFRIARHRNQGLKTALVEFNKRAAEKAAAAAAAKAAANKNANASEKERLLRILTNNQPLSYTNRARIMSRRKNANLQNALRKYNASKKAARELAGREKALAKATSELNKHLAGSVNNSLIPIRNYRNKLVSGLEFNNKKAAELLEAYNKAHRGRPGLMHNANVRELRKQLANFKKNAATQKKSTNNAAEQQRLKNLANRLLAMENSNQEFLVEYKKLGMFGRRKFESVNKQRLNAKYTRIMKAAANKAAANKAVVSKAKANKAAANKAAANKAAANRKFQINSALTEILTHNQATIKSRVASNLNTGFKGWRKVANKEKLKRLNEKLRPVPSVPAFNNAALRKAVQNHFSGVKPIYNKALLNAILAHPNMKLTNNQRAELTKVKPTGGGFFSGLFGRKPASGRVTTGSQTNTGGGFFSGLFGPKAPSLQAQKNSAIKAGLFKPQGAYGESIPIGYLLKTGALGLGYYRNNKAAQSQLNAAVRAAKGTQVTNAKPSGYGGPWGPGGGGYGGPHGSGGGGYGGPWGPGGGIVFAPKINVGAARIGAQTFGGTRVGGQQMGGSRLRGGNTGSTTLKTGNTQVSNVGKLSNAGKVSNSGRVSNAGKVANSGTTSNAGRLAVSAPTSSGNRQLAATSEQLIRSAGGAEAVEQGIKALNAANGNVNKAKATSRLPNKTFTNIYAMGGPVAAKRLVQIRRRRRTVGGRRVGTGTRGAPGKKKRVAQKPRKQYIKLTPYQFRRLTDHIKKNNRRKVLRQEITH